MKRNKALFILILALILVGVGYWLIHLGTRPAGMELAYHNGSRQMIEAGGRLFPNFSNWPFTLVGVALAGMLAIIVYYWMRGSLRLSMLYPTCGFTSVPISFNHEVRYFIYIVAVLALLAFFVIGYFLEGLSPGTPATISKDKSKHFYIEAEGPKSITSNASVPITAKVIMNDYQSSSANQRSSEELKATMRLQPGSFSVPTPLTDWQESKRLTVKESPDWLWILSPSSDKMGNQYIALEAKVLDAKGTAIETVDPLVEIIEVKSPLGIPAWIGYVATGLGGLLAIPLTGWAYAEISLRLKEKREIQRKEEEDAQKKSEESEKAEASKKEAEIQKKQMAADLENQ